MRITFFGTGTSVGVPVIGCDCHVCTSEDPRNRRNRSSVWLRFRNRSVLIDTPPEFRIQALRYKLRRIDAVLFTHAHADHIFGFDDLRRYNQLQREVIPAFGSKLTLDALRRIFGYAFDPVEPNWGLPQVRAHEVEGPFELFGEEVVPVTVLHGRMPVTAYRFTDVAYVTDCSRIPEEAMAALQGLDTLILDTLRHRSHPTHLSLPEALDIVDRLRPRRAFLTHISHELEHAAVEAELPQGVHLAYDGLTLDIGNGSTTSTMQGGWPS